VLDDQGRSEAAIECLRKAVQVAPDYSDAMYNLALLLQRKNQCAEAEDYWRRDLALEGRSEWWQRAAAIRSISSGQRLEGAAHWPVLIYAASQFEELGNVKRST